MNPTDYVVAGAVGFLLLYEAWTLGNKREADTISETVWRTTLHQPLVPFLVGLLCGHFFWLPRDCWELMK